MTDVLKTINKKTTPQSQRASARQVQNSAGGFSFEVTPEERLRRFLILGVDGGTYYASVQTLARENATFLEDIIEKDPDMVLRVLKDVSMRGAAPRQNATLFTLAFLCSVDNQDTRRAALRLLPDIARTGTHLFLFAGYVEQFRGWGRGLRKAVANWYTEKSTDTVAYQTVKYRQREGWSHRDLLRLAHPVASDDARSALFAWITQSAVSGDLPRIVEGFIAVNAAKAADIPDLIREYRLPWEALPDSAMNKPETWEALLDVGVPYTALMRQLPRLTKLGVIAPLGGGRTQEIVAQLTNKDAIMRARVHPMSILIAMRAYAGGYGTYRDSSWTPVTSVVDALDKAFYLAFDAVESTGKRTMLALDVSGSMNASAGGLPITCREAESALAMVTAAVEDTTMIVGFTAGKGWSTEVTPLHISPKQRLTDVTTSMSRLQFGDTDCALPMLYALENNLKVDTFVVYTDNQTWAGQIHPHQALQKYRQKMGIPAKLIVVGMATNGFSIADPDDAGMMDIVGFDPSVPQIIAQFSAQ